MILSLNRFGPELRADFERVHSEECDAGWCHCVAWWVPTWDGWGERTAEENAALREQLLEAGQYDGYLLHADGDPACWCQCGLRDRLPKLAAQFDLPPDPGTYAFTCFLTVPIYRHRNFAARLLHGVLTDLRELGVHSVEAFPRRGETLEHFEVWNGPEDMFRLAGFRVVRDDPTRPVLRLEL
jgi:hypothetical protein